MAPPTLSLDIGNTAVKWRLRQGRSVKQGRVLHDARPAEVIAAALMAQGLPGARTQGLRSAGPLSGDRPQARWRLAYSAVAHPQKVTGVLRPLEQLLQTSGSALLAQPRLALWLQRAAVEVLCGYADPAELGADRWAAVLGVTRQIARIRRAQAAQMPSAATSAGQSARRGRTTFSVWLVSAGTATVVDLVRVGLDAEGRLVQLGFQGGCILPGIGLTQEALSQATGALATHMPRSTERFSIRGLPQNSRDAIGYGIAAAQSSGLLALPRPAGVVVHGGYAKDWLRYFRAVLAVAAPSQRRSRGPFILEAPHLVLDGVEQWANAVLSPGPARL